MYLAEAILRRRDLQQRQSQLKLQLRRNLIVQEGDAPAEDPEQLLERLRIESAELSRLTAAINHTNNISVIELTQGRMTIAEALTLRDHLRNWVNILRDTGERSVPAADIYTRTEIRRVAVINAARIQSDADKVSRELQELVIALQRIEWKSTLEGYLGEETIVSAEV